MPGSWVRFSPLPQASNNIKGECSSEGRAGIQSLFACCLVFIEEIASVVSKGYFDGRADTRKSIVA
ncbi:MAG: hypothetical protein BGO84_02010 [Dysgonomonas sp. 37-18]|nr:MAG: hypothetical protein BGO84_02010 [Dysgonomonas sp. 37-18]